MCPAQRKKVKMSNHKQVVESKLVQACYIVFAGDISEQHFVFRNTPVSLPAMPINDKLPVKIPRETVFCTSVRTTTR